MKRLWRWIEAILWTGRDIERAPSFNFDPPSPEPIPIDPDVNWNRPGQPKVKP